MIRVRKVFHPASGTDGFRPSSKSLAPSSTPEPILGAQKNGASSDHRQILGELAYGMLMVIPKNTLKNLLLWLCKGDCLQFF